jgi:hypothetical protein
VEHFLSTEAGSVIISNPSQTRYNTLLTTNPNTLNCPCRQVSIEFQNFMIINITMHPICSSDFANINRWDYLSYDKQWYLYEYADIRVRGAAYFALLSTLCTLSQLTINTIIDQFVQTVLNGNAFISSHYLNWYWQTEVNRTFDTQAVTMSDGCSCGRRSDCITSGGICSNDTDPIFLIPGWNVGCSVFDTLLHSIFECFYNQACIDLFYDK